MLLQQSVILKKLHVEVKVRNSRFSRVPLVPGRGSFIPQTECIRRVIMWQAPGFGIL